MLDFPLKNNLVTIPSNRIFGNNFMWNSIKINFKPASVNCKTEKATIILTQNFRR
jgi:hypothetical protein